MTPKPTEPPIDEFNFAIQPCWTLNDIYRKSSFFLDFQCADRPLNPRCLRYLDFILNIYPHIHQLFTVTPSTFYSMRVHPWRPMVLWWISAVHSTGHRMSRVCGQSRDRIMARTSHDCRVWGADPSNCDVAWSCPGGQWYQCCHTVIAHRQFKFREIDWYFAFVLMEETYNSLEWACLTGHQSSKHVFLFWLICSGLYISKFLLSRAQMRKQWPLLGFRSRAAGIMFITSRSY